jgi:hypothetical protein
MILDLCKTILDEMSSSNIQSVTYPQWQKPKRVIKRFNPTRSLRNHHDIEEFVQKKVLEILNLNSRSIHYSKWRVLSDENAGTDKFIGVLNEEMRRTEFEWSQYDDDYTKIKFKVADSIFNDLIDTTITQCLAIVEQRLSLNSRSTRL